MLKLKGPQVKHLHAAMRDHEIVIWNGHSSHGTSQVYDACEHYPKDSYQVFFVNSCRSYAYYVNSILSCNVMAGILEPDFWPLIDVVSNLNAGYFNSYAEHSRILLFHLLAGCENATRNRCGHAGPDCRHRFDWAAIIESMNEQALKYYTSHPKLELAVFGASGVGTNCFEPGSWDNCPGVVHGSNNRELDIPDGAAAGVNSVIDLNTDRTVHEMVLELEIEHERTAQLIVELEHNGDVAVVRWLEPGDRRLHLTVPVRLFDLRHNATGTWTLTVTDTETGHGGRLVRWALHLY